MSLRKNRVVVLAVVAALVLISACERPIQNPTKLSAIKVEAQMLMKAHPVAAEITRAQWPPAVASLKPEFVTIDPDGLHITTRAYFDGGWGYFVPRKSGPLPEPVGRFEKVADGVFWWHPY
ncbi:hypothetical protein SH591_10490 [Sphingomonas sp. LY54]|uniref:hypothetical protein n=1 Tax=Sphingomonas sp. LY54 TaxID=3095343 RepID=UPI002D76A72A|nr:hypothetical protein [Sphingomonas sp. LY54]WRP27547.1 hypothetical protein SH591_10490 [Sphingomonas sp. LY54]